MISDQHALQELISCIAHSPRIAIDTEADSLHSYFEKLCLIQVSIPQLDTLVDPLADLDLQPFFSAVESKRVVFHGADYDLRLINRNARFHPADLFDTMIAARLIGSEALGLAALVEKHFGVTLSKASQKANWALRPLPSRMIEYAMNDTRYLLDISNRLEEDLRSLGRWDWFRESVDRMIASARIVRARDDDRAWRISGSAALPTRAQSVLRILWQWRDSEAQAWDRPPFHVMSNRDLLDICRKVVNGQPYSTPRMSAKRRKSFEVVLALALGIPESEWPTPQRGHRKKYTRERMQRFEKLRELRDRQAKALGLDPSIVAPKQGLEAAADDPDTHSLMHWQRELLNLPPLTLERTTS